MLYLEIFRTGFILFQLYISLNYDASYQIFWFL